MLDRLILCRNRVSCSKTFDQTVQMTNDPLIAMSVISRESKIFTKTAKILLVRFGESLKCESAVKKLRYWKQPSYRIGFLQAGQFIVVNGWFDSINYSYWLALKQRTMKIRQTLWCEKIWRINFQFIFENTKFCLSELCLCYRTRKIKEVLSVNKSAAELPSLCLAQHGLLQYFRQSFQSR